MILRPSTLCLRRLTTWLGALLALGMLASPASAECNQPPCVKTVTSVGGANVLEASDANDQRVWTGTSQRRCADFPAGSTDGVYTVVDRDGEPHQVWCDMQNGGWMLVGKVYRSHIGNLGISEPDAWWRLGTDPTGPIPAGTVDYDFSGSDLAAYGVGFLRGFDFSIARFDAIAELAASFVNIDDAIPGQAQSFYKDASTFGTWFSEIDTPTLVCPSASLDCLTKGAILKVPDHGTYLEGMVITHGHGPIHLRTNGDSSPDFDGLCSWVDDAAWPNDAAGWWGNGLDIWVK